MVKSAYEYDAFGNRTSLTENDTKTSYTYDVLDRLVQVKELNNSPVVVKTGLKCSQGQLHFNFAKAKHRFLKGVSEIYAMYGLN